MNNADRVDDNASKDCHPPPIPERWDLSQIPKAYTLGSDCIYFQILTYSG